MWMNTNKKEMTTIMDMRIQAYIERFFQGVFLDGQPITGVLVKENPDGAGTGVFLFTDRVYFYHACLHFPSDWELPTLITKEEWQEYMEASQAVGCQVLPTMVGKELVPGF